MYERVSRATAACVYSIGGAPDLELQLVLGTSSSAIDIQALKWNHYASVLTTKLCRSKKWYGKKNESTGKEHNSEAKSAVGVLNGGPIITYFSLGSS